MKFPVFRFVSTASYLFTGHYWEVSGSVFLTPSHQVFIYVNEILPEPSLHQVKQSQLSQPLLNCQMLQKSIWVMKYVKTKIASPSLILSNEYNQIQFTHKLPFTSQMSPVAKYFIFLWDFWNKFRV